MNFTTTPKVTCIACNPYEASSPEELSIRPGDVIREVEQLPGGWWRGELLGQRGMFPDNFVSVINEQNKSGLATGVRGYCRALFSYQPANDDELQLYVGDVLEVLDEVEEGWWQGRRAGHERVGVFPSNFVIMMDPPAPPCEPAPALPPKPTKEQCRVLFPYTAVNEDELTLAEGDIVTLVSRDTADRGWWRGELLGNVGLFPDNFVELLPADPTNNKIAQPPEDGSKPERPPAKTNPGIYPALNKYFEKTASVKELTTSKISVLKESVVSKESTTPSTVTHTNKSEQEKHVHSKTTTDGALDALKFSDEEVYGSKSSVPKKPSVPLKKSPTPTSGVGGLFSGLKSKKMPTSEKDKSEKQPSVSLIGSSNGGEWDRLDGGAPSKPAASAPCATTNTFDHIERNSILNDPRAGRAKAPRRRPRSQALREDTPQQIGLSNGHEVPVDKLGADKADEIKPRTREWEKHKAPWMEELKLNQAKKTSFVADGKPRYASTSSDSAGVGRASSGSTDRILDCGVEEKRSTHSMEMSKSTSSISNRISVLESFDASLETKVKNVSETKKELSPGPRNTEPPAQSPPPSVPSLPSPTSAGRTLTAMLDEIKKPTAPPVPIAAKTELQSVSPSRADRTENIQHPTAAKLTTSIETSHKTSTLEKTEKLEEKIVIEKERVTDRPSTAHGDRTSTLERRSHSKVDKTETNEGAAALIAQLNSRILNLEKLLEVQNAKFSAAIEHLNTKLGLEVEKRQALQAEMEKLAQCVTQV